jgi:hypothetical protein
MKVGKMPNQNLKIIQADEDESGKMIDRVMTAMKCFRMAVLILTVEIQRTTETFARYAAVSRQFQQIVDEWYLEVSARRNYRRSAVALTAAVTLVAIVGKF